MIKHCAGVTIWILVWGMYRAGEDFKPMQRGTLHIDSNNPCPKIAYSLNRRDRQRVHGEQRHRKENICGHSHKLAPETEPTRLAGLPKQQRQPWAHSWAVKPNSGRQAHTLPNYFVQIVSWVKHCSQQHLKETNIKAFLVSTAPGYKPTMR